MQTFARVLLPLIKGYQGKLIKSIGDAYLITFLSPTDAMLCSMALQDAMHGNNLNVIEEERIHIRIAANLGEVRVAKNDIFGEPVNVASRIEGVTPGDAIYLSEAVYMAMNKAEVPVEEIGFKDLAGVSQSVRLYCIPRFSVNRLVPQKSDDIEVGNELVYPYGGMHCHAHNDTRFSLDFSKSDHKTKLSLSVLILFIIILILSWYLGLVSFNPLHSENSAPVTSPLITSSSNSSTTPLASHSTSQIKASTTKTQTQEKHLNDKANLPISTAEAKQNQSVSDNPPKKASSVSNQEKLSVDVPTRLVETVKPAVVVKTVKPPAQKVEINKPITWNVRKAKLAYRDNTLTKTEYNEVIRELKLTYKSKITKIKADYNSDKMTKSEYKIAVTKAKNEYKGN